LFDQGPEILIRTTPFLLRLDLLRDIPVVQDDRPDIGIVQKVGRGSLDKTPAPILMLDPRFGGDRDMGIFNEVLEKTLDPLQVIRMDDLLKSAAYPIPGIVPHDFFDGRTDVARYAVLLDQG